MSDKIEISEMRAIDESLKLPHGLICQDGRQFQITSWRPCVSVDAVVTAQIEVIVELPKIYKVKSKS